MRDVVTEGRNFAAPYDRRSRSGKIRAHFNTLEWLPIFLPFLWLFAVYGNSDVAAALGLVWPAGRIVHFLGYVSPARNRFPGFFIQAFAAGLLLIGALRRLAYLAWFASVV